MEIRGRIKVILEREQLSQVEFSERTAIKPATLNHVLTGRNNASREVIEKILESFPWYNEDWLVLGQGAMLTDAAKEKIQSEHSRSLFPDFQSPVSSVAAPRTPSTPTSTASALPPTERSVRETPPQSPRKIAKIIVYYTDNTFETLLPSDQAT